MQLTIVLVVMAMFAAMEAPLSSPPHAARSGVVIIIALTFAVPLTAIAASIRTARRLSSSGDSIVSSWRRFQRFRLFHLAFWAVSMVGATYGLAWPDLVRGGADHWIMIDELIILAPPMLSLLATWAAFSHAEHALEQTLGSAQEHVSCWRRVMLLSRHNLGVVLAPMLLMVFASDVTNHLAPQLFQQGRGWLVYPPVLICGVIIFPALLRRVWETQPLPEGPLRKRLMAAAEKAGVSIGEVFIWNTGHRMMNAATSGFVAPLRYVFLTDLLLTQLSDDEIEAVFLHEVGHIRGRHLLQRLALFCFPLGIAAVILGQVQWEPSSSLVQLGLTGVGFVLLLLLLGRFSRWLEFQADSWAAQFQHDRAPLCGALEKLGRWSGDAKKRSWLHPSLADRIAVLARCGD